MKAAILFLSGLGNVKKPKSQISEAEFSSLRYSAADLECGFQLRPDAYGVYRRAVPYADRTA
jgi:hypothetical protein